MIWMWNDKLLTDEQNNLKCVRQADCNILCSRYVCWRDMIVKGNIQGFHFYEMFTFHLSWCVQ
jgi:hypothetical protein